MRDLERLYQSLLMTLSAPVKPGAVHRLRVDPVFERRLSQAVVLSKWMSEAYERGRMLARGRVDSKSLGLGKLVGEALRDSFEFTESRPIPGLVAAAITLSVVAGYASVSGRRVPEEARRLSRLLMYGSSYADSEALVGGLEAVGASDYLLRLEEAGLSRRLIRLEGRSLGDVFEALSGLDSGFLFNARGVDSILEGYSRALQASNIVEAVIVLFYYYGRARGVFKDLRAGARIIDYFVRLEKGRMFQGYQNDVLLGGVLWSLSLAHLDRGLALP